MYVKHDCLFRDVLIYFFILFTGSDGPGQAFLATRLCSYCAKEFNSAAGLNIHERMEHGEVPDLPYACCGKRYPSVSHYRRHM